ncbi:HAD family hydrolase [bacterium]|nr:HAD family hydrolase [bacterium]
MGTSDRIDLLGVLFDLDGTLTRPMIDFASLKTSLGLPADGDILVDLANLPERQRRRAMLRLEAVELAAARQAVAAAGARELLTELSRRGIYTVVVTRNSRASLDLTLERLGLEVDLSLAREDAAPKPDPDGILKACRHFRIPSEHMLVVGDYKYDVEAGRLAGCPTVLVRSDPDRKFPCEPTMTVQDLGELHRIILGWLG